MTETVAERAGVLSILRPRKAGEIIDAAFAIFREQPLRILGVALPMIIPIEALAATSQFTALKSLRNSIRGGLIGLPVPIWVSAGDNIASLSAWLLEFFITVVVVFAASSAFLGREIGIAESYRAIARRFPQILGLFFVWLGVVVGPMVLSVALLVAGGGGLGIFFIALSVPWTIFAWVQFRLAPSAFVIEGIGPFAAIHRSWSLVKASWWRAFGVVLMAEFISWIVNAGIQTAILLVTSSRPPVGIGFAAIAFGMVLLPAITVRPFSAIVDVTLYYDLRVRREGLDIDAAISLRNGEAIPLEPMLVDAKWEIPWSPVQSSLGRAGRSRKPTEAPPR